MNFIALPTFFAQDSEMKSKNWENGASFLVRSKMHDNYLVRDRDV